MATLSHQRSLLSQYGDVFKELFQLVFDVESDSPAPFTLDGKRLGVLCGPWSAEQQLIMTSQLGVGLWSCKSLGLVNNACNFSPKVRYRYSHHYHHHFLSDWHSLG